LISNQDAMSKSRSSKAMGALQFGTLNLNLLRVFDAVTEERNVARAGRKLGQSPSAVSHALGRLRHALKDDLFVRGKTGMQLTSRAAEIAPSLHQLLLQLPLILAPAEFRPPQTDRRFTISCGPYAGSVLLPQLIARLRAEAPRSELRIRWDNCDIVDELTSGRIDLAIGDFGRIPKSLENEFLYIDEMIWVVSGKRALRRQELTLEDLADLPHLIVTSTGDIAESGSGNTLRSGLELSIQTTDRGALDLALTARGLQRKIALIVPSSMLPWSIASNTDLAALLPRRQALTLPRMKCMRLFSPPYPCPSIKIQSLWHREFGSTAPLIWFRNLLKEIAAQL
jgi:DNA-binding transcriptional LysR family regulator